MTYAAVTDEDFSPYAGRRASRRLSAASVLGVAALSAGVVGGSWMLAHRFIALPDAEEVATAIPAPAAFPASIMAEAPSIVARTAGRPMKPYVLADRDGSTAVIFSPKPLGQSAPLPAGFAAPDRPAPGLAVAEARPTVIADAAPQDDDDDAQAAIPLPVPASPVVAQAGQPVPLPVPRPAVSEPAPAMPVARPAMFAAAPEAPPAAAPPAPRAPMRRYARLRSPAIAAPAPDNRSFFAKLFGIQDQPPAAALGYASAESASAGYGRSFGGSRSFDDPRAVAVMPTATLDRQTAVYDIAAHTVTLPDGTRLEAHSGLGGLLDDPRSVHQRNRGATPPNLYALTFREALFHGVRALRLTPIGGGTVYGRTGLLAHTYMLGPNGDSNGCVSFRDYNRFLQAFQNGEVRRLAVVARQS